MGGLGGTCRDCSLTRLQDSVMSKVRLVDGSKRLCDEQGKATRIVVILLQFLHVKKSLSRPECRSHCGCARRGSGLQHFAVSPARDWRIECCFFEETTAHVSKN